MRNLFFLSALLPLVAQAFPTDFAAENNEFTTRSPPDLKKMKDPLLTDPLGISKAQTNCGPTPCLTFSEKDQLVSVTGEHAYASPAPDEIRGPCPGLNAAANHGYLPRDGIASIEETVFGLRAAYNMNAALGAALAAYAIAFDGNIIQMVWSIGGPLPKDPAVKLLGTGQGLSYSHNNYEGDSSIGRNDAYLDNGNAHSLNVTKFQEVYQVAGKSNRYTLDKFRKRFENVQDFSIANNPYYFTGAFSTIVVVPAAYNFVINFMSNHTKEEPSGYLDGYNFKQFFAVRGEPPHMKWLPGQERIPNNWYRRPSSNQYTGQDVALDVGIGYAAYPRTLRIGGNTGKPNSYVGVSVANFTGGVFDAGNLFKGDNFQCFAFSIAENGLPDFVKGPLNQLNKAEKLLGKHVNKLIGDLNCPQLGKSDQGLFNQFPGRFYSPTGPATNY